MTAYDDLPQVAPSHLQSATAEQGVERLFGLPRFICRRETPDYGIDYTVEVVLEGNATNFRASLQLKSQASGEYVANGQFISVEIETSRLNYLERGAHNALVVAYDADKKHFFFEWVHTLVQVLDGDPSRSGWRDQGSVSVRLPTANQVTDDALDAIHGSILDYERRRQDIVRFSQSYTVSVIAGPSAKATTGEAAAALTALRDDGFKRVSRNSHDAVIDDLESLPRSQWYQDPQLTLLAAFAYHRRGAMLKAMHFAERSRSLGAASMSTGPRALLESILNDSRYALGLASSDQYRAGLREVCRQYADTEIGYQKRMEDLWFQLRAAAASGDPGPLVDRILHDAETLLRQAQSAASVNSELILSLTLWLGRLESAAAIQITVDDLRSLRSREAAGFPATLDERVAVARRIVRLTTRGSERIQAVFNASRESGLPELEALALLAAAETDFEAHQSRRLAAPGRFQDAIDPGQLKALSIWLNFASDAAEIFGKLGMRRMALEARRLVVDVLTVLERLGEAAQVTDALEIEARTLDLDPQQVEPKFLRLRREVVKARQDPNTHKRWLASLPDGEVARYAHLSVRSLGLPEDRLQVVQDAYFVARRVAQEAVTFCQYLDYLEDRTGTDDQSTAYASKPLRVVHCRKLGLQTVEEDSEIVNLIRIFKEQRCKGCPLRAPLP